MCRPIIQVLKKSGFDYLDKKKILNFFFHLKKHPHEINKSINNLKIIFN
jgi:hypothetical protein